MASWSTLRTICGEIMRNRAKCKLCEDIIESFHATDLVLCKCGEISVDGGDSLRCAAKNWNNFMRVDDEGNLIMVTVKDDIEAKEGHVITKKEKIDMLRELIESIDRLPNHAQHQPVNHSDLSAALVLLHSILSEGL